MRYCKIHAVLTTLSFAFFSLLYFHCSMSKQDGSYAHASTNKHLSSTIKRLQKERKPYPKVILIYSTLFGSNVWHGLEGTNLYTRLEEYNCMVTYNKLRINMADAVLFHARDVEVNRHGIYSAKNLLAAKQKAPQKQKWIFLSHENPQKDSSIYAPYNGLFNWTATFSRQSDVFLPYSSYIQLEEPIEDSWNYAKGKTGSVAWAVSNCNLMRQDYVLELEKFINITVFGKCGRFFKNRDDCAHRDPVCIKILSSYKFYLAFENDFCHDFVSDKYWQTIMQENIPVVMGATYDKSLVIPGSYIDAGSFTSIKALANYLKYLDSNDTAYNEFFQWKSIYRANPNEDLHVRICQALHSDKFKIKSEVMLSEEFSYKKMCGSFQWMTKMFQKQVNGAKFGDEHHQFSNLHD